jgi:hypothetical protein
MLVQIDTSAVQNVTNVFEQQNRSVELLDGEYLAAFEPRNRTQLLGAFTSAVRAARFSG